MMRGVGDEARALAVHIKPSDINCSLCSEAVNHGPFMGTEGQRKELRMNLRRGCSGYPVEYEKRILPKLLRGE